MTQYFEHVFREGGDAIVAVVGPVGFAMAAKVDGDRLPSALGNRGGRSAPRAAGLAAPPPEKKGRRQGGAQTGGDGAEAAHAHTAGTGWWHAHPGETPPP